MLQVTLASSVRAMSQRDLPLYPGDGEEEDDEAEHATLSLMFLLRSLGSFLFRYGMPPWWRVSRDELLCRRVGVLVVHRFFLYGDHKMSCLFMAVFVETGILSPLEFSRRLLSMNCSGGPCPELVEACIQMFIETCDIFRADFTPHVIA